MSNIINCKDCGQEVSKRAKTCPHCGVKNPWGDPSYVGRAVFAVMFGLLLFVGGIDEAAVALAGAFGSSDVVGWKIYLQLGLAINGLWALVEWFSGGRFKLS